MRRQAVLCPKPLPESAELPEGTFGWLIERYKKNSRYTERAPGTRRLYDGYLKHMMEDYGDLPIRSIKPKTIAAIRDKLSGTPASANQTLALFRILLRGACRRLSCVSASRPMAARSWSWCRSSSRHRKAMSGTGGIFSRAWDTAMRRMNFRIAKGLFRGGLKKDEVRKELTSLHRQRRDLRRTAMVRMAEAGATTPQIAAVSGHSIDSCQKILDVYLPRRADIALGAIWAWEKQEESARSVLTTVFDN